MGHMTQLPAELATIRDFVRWGASRFNEAGLFFGHGTDNALDEALALVLHGLHLTHELPEPYLDAQVTHEEREVIVSLLNRRIEGRMPAAYLIHEAWFAGFSFYVDERVLVPRSPIAELIQRGFAPWVEEQRVERALDLCTGSGCIAIAMAYAFPDATVDAVDISTDALAVAQINVERHHMQGRVQLLRSNLLDEVPQTSYDLMVSNPPYVSSEEMQTLPQEYLREPRLGLESGEQGLDAAIRILAAAPRYLNEDGVLVMEVGNSAQALVERFPEVPFLWVDFAHGGQGVFILEVGQLREHHSLFAAA